MSSSNRVSPVSCIVIDDDVSTADVFSEYLSIKGIDVLAVGYDAQSAVHLFVKKRPDIVFLDVMMDPLDGLYALEKIRSIDPNAKVIMVTADLRQDTDEKLHHLGASAIVFKPFEISEIMDAVDTLVNCTASRDFSIPYRPQKTLVSPCVR